MAFLGVFLSYDGRFVYCGFAFTVLNRKMLQLLYQRMPMRTEQVSEKPDEIVEENFFELISQPTGLVILLVFSCYEERTKFQPGCEAFTLLNTDKTCSFFNTCSLWNLEGLGGSGSHFNFYRRWVDVLFATRKMMKINRRETKDEAMTLMMVTMMTLMTMTLFKVTRESHVSSEFQT